MPSVAILVQSLSRPVYKYALAVQTCMTFAFLRLRRLVEGADPKAEEILSKTSRGRAKPRLAEASRGRGGLASRRARPRASRRDYGLRLRSWFAGYRVAVVDDR